MHILIVNSSSLKMTLSNSLCKHFYIRSKLKGKGKKSELSLTFFSKYVCIRV